MGKSNNSTLLSLDGRGVGGEGVVVATTLSDKEGKYRFINLKPGRYQVRCYPGKYLYFGQKASAIEGTILHVKDGASLKNIDFRFPPFKKGTWKTYTHLDGLGSNSVYAIYSAPDGTLWFATQGGVSRYDGKEFVNFTTQDGLAHNDVRAICGTPDGILWFGTRGGVSRYDGKEFKDFTTKDGLANNYVTVIHRASDGALWFGTGWIDVPGGGVSRYDGKEFKNFTTKDGLASNTVVSINSGPNGVMWFGAVGGGGVFRFDGKEFKSFIPKDGFAGYWVNAIHSAPDGALWFGTFSYGVYRFDGKELKNFTIKDGLLNNWVNAIHAEPNGVIYFGIGPYAQISDGGVSRYDGKSFVNFTTEDGLAYDNVLSIYRAPDGALWFGTDGGGVSRYEEEGIENLTTKDGLAHNSVRAIYRAKDGVLWFGTQGGGVSRYDGKEFKNFTTKDGLAHNNVWSIHPLPDGSLCFGTGWDGGGVSRYDGKNFEDFTVKVGLPRVQIFAVHGASDGTMWFGTVYYGAFQYDGKKVVNFLAGKIVWAIHQAPDGAIWFGTPNGVFRYDGKEFKNFTEEDGLADNWVYSIHADPDGALWFGTLGGVSRYEGSPHFEGGVRGGKKFVNFTKKDGLAGNGVNVIYRDFDGRLWFGTSDGGVSCYDGVNWTSLDKRDGLAGNSVASIYQDSDGSLWFGTDGGVTHYRRASVPTKVHIVSVTTDKTYRDLSAIPAFTPKTRVTIAYSAIDFKTVPEKRQYRCRIVKIPPDPPFSKGGTDSDWCKPTKSTSFDYTFDKPGKYTFEVQAIDRDLNYSEPANVTLKVAQPFYLRAAFLAPTVSLGALLLAALVIQAVVLVKHRRQVLAYQRLAVQELQDAHDMQMGLMPKTAPPIEGVEVAGRCLSANTVSGDFFDYLAGKRDNEIALVIADVTGKAMKGAMNAVMADGILHAKAEEMELLSPALLMMKLNNVLKTRMEQEMNITMVIAAINRNRVLGKNSVSVEENSVSEGEHSVSEGETTLTLANAAHHAHPLLLRDGEIQTLKTGGLPLGMRAGIKYTEEQFKLQSGDVLILMTDGIIEAQNSETQLYSDSGRLEETISQFAEDLSAEALVNAIINDAINFGGDKTTRGDDMTVVVAKIQ